MSNTRRNLQSSWQCVGSILGGPLRGVPPHPGPLSKCVSLRRPTGEAADPLARLAACELGDWLAHHLLELSRPLLDNIRNQSLQVVELLSFCRYGFLGKLFLVLLSRRPRRNG